MSTRNNWSTTSRRAPRDHCEVPGCIARPGRPGSTTCAAHTARRARYGAPLAVVTHERDLKPHLARVERGLRIFANTPAVREALRRAERLLTFSDTERTTWSRWLSSRMLAVRLRVNRPSGTKRGHPITAHDVLVRVLAFHAYEQANPHRVPTTDAHLIGLARVVTRLARAKEHNAPTKVERLGAGRWIASELGAFCVAFLRALERHETAERVRQDRARRLLNDFTDPANPEES